MNPLRQFHRLLAGAVNRALPPRGPWALALALDPSHRGLREIQKRFPFYMPGWTLYSVPPKGRFPAWQSAAAALRRVPVLYVEQRAMESAPRLLRGNPRYWLNPVEDMREPEEWLALVRDFSGTTPDLEEARKRLAGYIERHRLRTYAKCYVFGTGPSLAKAVERDWSDGARIVCNTIVRDPALWNHIRPHVILASDAAYHFGFARHASAFRSDLKKRLKETDTLFLYAAEFDALARREFADVADRLVPVPKAKHKQIDRDMTRYFEWPNLHNILPRMLAVACSIADDVLLWGFDGRAPQAQGFWDNSSRHSYPEHMAELREAYPAFYECLVPKQDGEKYVRIAFGDELENCLAQAERRGKHFVMLHDTWTPTLRKRMQPAGAETERAQSP